jgi:hypothetical protein
VKTQTRLVFLVIWALAFGLLLLLGWILAVNGDPLLEPGISMPAATIYYRGEESEPNDTIDTANPISSFWTMVGQLPVTQSLDIDWYHLTLRDGDIGQLYEANLEEALPCADDFLRLGLFDADGDRVGENAGFGSVAIRWSTEVFTYYLKAWSDDAFGVADHDIPYELSVLPAPTLTPYPEETVLHLSFREGAPGSLITVTGFNFPYSDQISIWLNGRFIGAVPGYGWCQFQLDTAYAEEGLYIVVTQADSVAAAERFVLATDQPLRDPMGDGPIFPVPYNIAFSNQQRLPIVVNEN